MREVNSNIMSCSNREGVGNRKKDSKTVTNKIILSSTHQNMAIEKHQKTEMKFNFFTNTINDNKKYIQTFLPF